MTSSVPIRVESFNVDCHEKMFRLLVLALFVIVVASAASVHKIICIQPQGFSKASEDE